jgi:hypothetical protein
VSDSEAANDPDSSGPTPDQPVSDDVVEADVVEADVVETDVVETDVVDTQAPDPGTPPIDVIAEPVPVTPPDTGYTAAGVPTFDAVREKIETRFGASIGSAELAAETPQGRSIEEQYEARQKAAAERLEQIRASMRDEPDA